MCIAPSGLLRPAVGERATVLHSTVFLGLDARALAGLLLASAVAAWPWMAMHVFTPDWQLRCRSVVGLDRLSLYIYIYNIASRRK